LLLFFVICLIVCHLCFRTSRCFERTGVCKFKIGIRIGRSDDSDHDEWFLTVLQPHNGHPPEATALLRKPSRLHAEADLELVSAAMASYGGAGVARSLYYYRTGEVLDYPMIRRLKDITRNSTMTRGSAAQELLSELRFFHEYVTLYIDSHDRSLFISCWFFSACDRADASLDFIAVYNANKHITHTINLLERKDGEE
jgi:hypothetical protein